MEVFFKKLIFLLFIMKHFFLCAIPIHICTGSNSSYFDQLLNLIGSIHCTNYKNLKNIAIFDLGMDQSQINYLNTIEKVSLHTVEQTNSDILKMFPSRRKGYRPILGFFSWKGVCIKQALDLAPCVLWLDAGTTVLKPIDSLLEYIEEHGYFVCTTGDEMNSGIYQHNVGWGCSDFVKKKFNLDTSRNKWILQEESIMGGIIGASEKGKDKIIMKLYELSKDIRNYADDGTAPGEGRHDQVLLSTLVYLNNLVYFKQDYTQQTPMMLNIKGKSVPFYITWNKQYVNSKTHLYSSRRFLEKKDFYFEKIKFKVKS